MSARIGDRAGLLDVLGGIVSATAIKLDSTAFISVSPFAMNVPGGERRSTDLRKLCDAQVNFADGTGRVWP
ncbi:MAG TPA: hypothetical protein VK324_04355 [Tepidisphaeraceae bacterium]|nr:hypothetical protein [Tepidisphaeraceae bacterium]